MKRIRIAKVAVGLLVYGFGMGVLDEVANYWLRGAIAALSLCGSALAMMRFPNSNWRCLSGARGRALARIAGGSLVYGAIVAVLHEVAGLWLRMAIAGLSGCILAVVLRTAFYGDRPRAASGT